MGPTGPCSQRLQPGPFVSSWSWGVCTAEGSSAPRGHSLQGEGRGGQRSRVLASGCKAEPVQVPCWGVQCQAQPEIDSFTLEAPSLWLHCMLFFDDKIWGFPCASGREARPGRAGQNPVAPTALPPCPAASLPPPFCSSLSLSLLPPAPGAHWESSQCGLRDPACPWHLPEQGK